jgi:DNA replication protein DnaC
MSQVPRDGPATKWVQGFSLTMHEFVKEKTARYKRLLAQETELFEDVLNQGNDLKKVKKRITIRDYSEEDEKDTSEGKSRLQRFTYIKTLGVCAQRGMELSALSAADWQRDIHQGLRNAIYSEDRDTGLASIQSSARANVQNSIADMILAMRVGSEKFFSEFFNVLITGGAGTGKTTVARVLGYVLSQIRFMFFSQVIELAPADLKGEFKGETLQKTTVRLLQSLEHVLFLDEAYIMAGCDASGKQNKDNSDGQELIGALLTFTNDQKGNSVIVVAGYEVPMLKCFLRVNEGMARRFPETSRMALTNYSGSDLANILQSNVVRVAKQSKSNKFIVPGVFSPVVEWRIIRSTVKRMNEKSTARKQIFNGQAGDMDNLAVLLLKRADQQFQYFRQGFERDLGKKSDIDVQVERLQVIANALQEYAQSKGLEFELQTDSDGVLQPLIR